MIGIKWIGAGLVALALGGSLAFAASGQGGLHLGRAGLGHGRRAYRMEGRGEMHGLLESLQITNAQRAVLLQQAQAAEPIAANARKEAARILVASHDPNGTGGGSGDDKATRASVREQLKNLRERTFSEVEPLARQALGTLTPEQRAKIDEAAAKHGRTADEGKLLQGVAFWLMRPMTVPMLEARLGR